MGHCKWIGFHGLRMRARERDASAEKALVQEKGWENRPGYTIALFSTPERKYCLQAEITFSCQVQKSVYPYPTLYAQKTLPHKMTRQPRVHTNPNAKTAEPSKRLINKNAIVPPHSNIGFIARKCSVEKRFSFREK